MFVLRRVLLTGLVLSGLLFAADNKNIVWQNRYDDALKLAQDTGKPLLIDFWASWCGPCKRMDSDVWPDARLQAVADRYVFVSVDVDKDKGTEARYSVHAIPTVVIADPWGHAVSNHLGYTDAPEVLDMMGQLPSDYGKAKEWFDLLERDNKNTQALSHIGQFYGERHAFHISNEFFNDALKTSQAKEDENLREFLTLAIALNQFRDGSIADARKRLEQCLKAFPEGHHQDEILAALVAVEVRQGKRGEAEKNLQVLQRLFPESHATTTAAAVLAKTK